MTPKEERILQEVLALSPMERAVLVEEILRSFDQEPAVTTEIEAAWAEEARERMAAYHAGEISARSGDEVFADINRRLDR